MSPLKVEAEVKVQHVGQGLSLALSNPKGLPYKIFNASVSGHPVCPNGFEGFNKSVNLVSRIDL